MANPIVFAIWDIQQQAILYIFGTFKFQCRGPFLLTWIKFKPSMDKYLHPL